MKVRKVPLLIHIEPQQLTVLRKTVKLCPGCDLLIVHQNELEAELAGAFHERKPAHLGNPYVVLGTVDVAEWKAGMRAPGSPEEMLAQFHPFREELELHVTPGGWYPAELSSPAPKRG
jgi:hypothetical protein